MHVVCVVGGAILVVGEAFGDEASANIFQDLETVRSLMQLEVMLKFVR